MEHKLRTLGGKNIPYVPRLLMERGCVSFTAGKRRGRLGINYECEALKHFKLMNVVGSVEISDKAFIWNNNNRTELN